MGPKTLYFQVGLDPASALSQLPQDLLTAGSTHGEHGHKNSGSLQL